MDMNITAKCVAAFLVDHKWIVIVKAYKFVSKQLFNIRFKMERVHLTV